MTKDYYGKAREEARRSFNASSDMASMLKNQMGSIDWKEIPAMIAGLSVLRRFPKGFVLGAAVLGVAAWYFYSKKNAQPIPEDPTHH